MNTFNQTTPDDFPLIDDEDDFASAMARLEEENPIEATRTKTPKEKAKFPCQQCGGTGLYRGHRVHQEKTQCFACQGKGYFLSSPEQRAKSHITQAAKKADALGAFREEHAQLLETLAGYTSWNSFAASLVEQAATKPLSPNQVAAAYRMVDKVEANRAAKAVVKAAAPKLEIDLTPIRSMFETAVANGYKKPTYRAEGLVISRAPDTGSNPGALYVKGENDVYGGKILGTVFTPTRDGREGGFADLLLEIAKDPLNAALRYGQRTGRCACCGRELTKHSSIDAGIGPICKEKWGL